MVLTHSTNHTYSHPFPTVTLAYFLRYSSPQLNPFSGHVLSTDTISSHVDGETGRLHVTRIHQKKGRLPKPVLKLLPASMTGGTADKSSYILERSVVDMREGWMKTESRNLNFVGVLSVVEEQFYSLPKGDSSPLVGQSQPAPQPTNPFSTGSPSALSRIWRAPERASSSSSSSPPPVRDNDNNNNNNAKNTTTSPVVSAAGAFPTTTDVTTTVMFRSRLGERLRGKIGPAAAAAANAGDDGWLARGLMGGWTTKGIQRSIESIASSKTVDQLGKSREGMRVVLERLRLTGVMGVLELRRRTREGRADEV